MNHLLSKKKKDVWGAVIYRGRKKNTEKYQVCKRSLKAEHSRSK